MGEAIGEFLPLAVVVAFGPFPIIGAVVVLTAPGARSNGPAFVAGWAAGLALIGGLVLLVSAGVERAEPGAGDWVSWLKLVLGILAVLYAAKQWRGRPREGDAPKVPGWMESAARLSPVRSAALGLGLAAANPKNLMLVAGAMAPVPQLVQSAGARLATLGIFVLIATIGVAIPLILRLALGERAQPALFSLRDWLGSNNAVIMAALFLVIGSKLIGDAIAGLSV